jgi:hypothetical protein
MTKKRETKYGVFEGQLYYARVFPENMDNSEYHERTEGQYNCVFIPKDDDEIKRMLDIGFPEVSMGNQMIKTFDFADGRKGMKLKRPNKHPSGFEGLGGPPSVTVGTTSVPWSFENDGELGNGTVAKVKISVYGDGAQASVKIEKIGIIEHVPYSAEAAADRW